LFIITTTIIKKISKDGLKSLIIEEKYFFEIRSDRIVNTSNIIARNANDVMTLLVKDRYYKLKLQTVLLVTTTQLVIGYFKEYYRKFY